MKKKKNKNSTRNNNKFNENKSLKFSWNVENGC